MGWGSRSSSGQSLVVVALVLAVALVGGGVAVGYAMGSASSSSSSSGRSGGSVGSASSGSSGPSASSDRDEGSPVVPSKPGKPGKPGKPAKPGLGQKPSKSAKPSGKPRPVSGLPTGSQKVVVVGHTDGDTIKVRLGENGVAGRTGTEVSARLLEIDSPESKDPGTPVQCHAAEASSALARLMPLGSVAWAEADRDLLDPYGRTLLYFRTVHGNKVTFVNQRLVERGHAIAVLYEPNDRYIDLMRAAQARAERKRRGLWKACGYFGQPVSEKPRGLLGSAGRRSDPVFGTCGEATDAGFGDYLRGRDPEYFTYDDRDGDGVVCEF